MHLHLVRVAARPKPMPPPRQEQHAAKVIALRARREARADLVRVRRSDGPDAA